MWTLGSHSLSQNLINDLGREAKCAGEGTEGQGHIDGLLRPQADGMWLLKCHIAAVWCAGYSGRTVSIMVCVVMTVCFYGLVPREWMDALRPPVMSPSQQRRSGTTRTSQENLIRGTVTSIFAFFLLSPKSGGRQQQCSALTSTPFHTSAGVNAYKNVKLSTKTAVSRGVGMWNCI